MRQRKIAAFFLLMIFSISNFYPGIAYALTNGPTQPESSKFEAASVTNLVDPFTGDFNYNIPLLDVDGYPVNLAYNSNGSMDAEASWVGFGWNINPGSVNRIMKGIPDDFDGTDLIHKDYNIRPDITGGVSFDVSSELFGLDFLGANASCDIFYNNQRGLGVQIGANISGDLSSSQYIGGGQTAGLAVGGGMGITSNSQTGADFNYNANMSVSLQNDEQLSGSLGLSMGGSLNARSGLKSTTLSSSFNTSQKESKDQADIRDNAGWGSGGGFSTSLGSSTSCYGQAFTPTITMPLKNEDYSLSPMAGPYFWGFNEPTIQFTGNYTKQSLASHSKDFPAYGFIHSDMGRNDQSALLDFNREKDVPYMESTPTIAVPYVTPDIFTATSHLGSSQFKAFSNSSGVFFDSYATNSSDAFSLGVEFGAGAGVKGGADISGNFGSTVTRKWKLNNDFLTYGDNSVTDPQNDVQINQGAYFKLVGEKSSVNKDYLNKIVDREAIKIKTASVNDQAKAFSTFATNNKEYPVNSTMAKNTRESKGEMFNPLTADQAAIFGLDKTIKSYPLISSGDNIVCSDGAFIPDNGSLVTEIPRNYTPALPTPPPAVFQRVRNNTDKRKGHHFSEITVTKNNGMRLIYGIPVYNNEQNDVTFNVDPTTDAVNNNNLVSYLDKENSTGNTSGREWYYSKEHIPAYATSFLLTGVCSPDYVDLTGDGITEDDPGTAVKFNYTMVNEYYNWRTPTSAQGSNNNSSSNTPISNYANFNEGLKSQTDDNKASISYGSKELWYMNSIESKNMVAIFRIGDRADGFGYTPDGALDRSSAQKKLEQIDLYTKAEILKASNERRSPIPIKSVHFEYDYSLFPGVSNNPGDAIDGNQLMGKLTLKSVYFTYANNTSGDQNRYYFNYNSQDASGNQYGFEYQQYDRWGNYKDKNWNTPVANLNNNDFPYSVQDMALANASAARWQLSQIELPSGGKINIDYESDDYSFVQNKRAMQMAKIIGYKSTYNSESDNFTDFQSSNKIYIQLPAVTSNVKWDYFDGVDQLYFKTMVDLDNNGNNELVSGYAKIDDVKLVDVSGNYVTSSDIAEVTVEPRGGFHPVAAAAWQFLRLSLPQLAFPYNVNNSAGPLQFVSALVAAIRNVAELLTPFEQRAMRLHYASNVIPGQGFARINNCMATGSNPDDNKCKFRKFGGGLRVKKITMDDNWSEMEGSGQLPQNTTGMSFDYTRSYKDNQGQDITISSGVASYEPMSGSDENPFKQPITYSQKAHLNTNMYTVEEPVGESYFPAPSVGYSQVTIRNLDVNGNEVTNGYTVKRFYTSQDFPTVVKRTDLSKNKYHQTSIFGLFKVDEGNSVVLSQGVYVENNDMHGKPRSEETFDGTGKMLSGLYYHYKSAGTEQMSLDNNALTLKPDGTVSNDIIGQEVELFNDMREQVTDNTGVNLNLNLDILFFTFIIVPIPTCIPIVQSTYCGYQSASTVKVVNRYAIPDKITKIENGSTISTENILWDGLTGQVLLTRTQNGFNDPLYNFTLPAYMVDDYEKGMGAGYKNTGIIFKGVTIDAGQPTNTDILPYMVPGDELGVLSTQPSMLIGMKIWVTKLPDGELRFIDKDGNLVSDPEESNDLMLLRSGRRNLMDASTYSIVSLKNPVVNGTIAIDQSTEILNTSATDYTDEWSTDVKMALKCVYMSPNYKQHHNKNGNTADVASGDSIQQTALMYSAQSLVNTIALAKANPGPLHDCMCIVPVSQQINPYFSGLWGNWRQRAKYVYTTDRLPRPDPNNTALLPTDIRKGGIFKDFTSFYKVSHGLIVPQDKDDNGKFIDNNWIGTDTVTRINSKGEEIENKDALGKYSSAEFGFNGHLATAVCSNARTNEIAYDGFEDYQFYNSDNIQEDTCNDGHFNFRKGLRWANNDGSIEITNIEAHTGNYSMKVQAGVLGAFGSGSYTFSLDEQLKYEFVNDQMILDGGGLNPLFMPLAGKRYILTGWIKTEGDILTDKDDLTSIDLTTNTKATIVLNAGMGCSPFTAYAIKKGPKVEGWTRVMMDFTINVDEACLEKYLTVNLIPGTQYDAYFDDIRIQPYDGNMKSFVYDDRTLRLMAELDENNYATFYEYNDEGQLIRNKKETEKGIITIKEFRSKLKSNKNTNGSGGVIAQ